MSEIRNNKLIALPRQKEKSVIYWINWIPDFTEMNNQSLSACQVLVI